MTKNECNICASEVYTKNIISCPFCKFDACNKCVTRFLMEIEDSNPRCMNTTCKKIWSFEFLSDNFPSTFHNKKYRERRASILMGQEKSMLPSTQPLATEELRRRDIKNQMSCIEQDIKKLQKNINEKIVLRRGLGSSLNVNVNVKEEEKRKEVFIRACPVEECKGFLSTALKCGMCKVYVCKDCHIAKIGKYDEDHKCNPDTVATVKLLSSDTKPCPGCATPIYKIHGCDQMYCTQCHTAFSWNKGTIERGVIHNPHYYEWQRANNNGVIPRNVGDVGDVRCGGLVTITIVQRACRDFILTFSKGTYTKEEESSTFDMLSSAHRLVNHIMFVEIFRYPNIVNEINNSQLRVSFLLNEITEAQFMSKIKQKMKKQEKDGAINMILTMFTTIMSDLFGNIVNDKQNLRTYLNSMTKLREYTNTSLEKIGNRFKGVFPVITKVWNFSSSSKKPEKKGTVLMGVNM